MRLLCERRRYDSDHNLRNVTFEEHVARLVYHEGNLNSWWVELKPGVTGYESVAVSDLLRSHDERYSAIPKGWFANSGTAGSYDELYVLPEGMERLKDYLRLIEPLLKCCKGGAK